MENESLSAEGAETHINNPAEHDNSGPPEEQSRYWAKDLSYKKWSLVVSGLGFMLITAGMFFNYQQLKINTEQLRINTNQSHRAQQSMCAGVQVSVINLVTSLDRVFIEKESLRPYFYEGKPIDVNNKDYAQASAAAEMALDIFDLMAGQSRDYRECWSASDAWDAWIVDMFSTSPILRNTLEKRKDWYDKVMLDLYEKGKQRQKAFVN